MASPRKKSVTLRWSRVLRESGLRGVAQGPRGWHLWWGKKRLATVSVLYKGIGRATDGWYFVARSDAARIPLMNSCNVRGRTPAEARDLCVAYVLPLLASAHPEVLFKAPTRCPDVGAYDTVA